MLVLEKIREYAATDRVALINREERLSFRQLDADSDAFAAWLLEQLGDDRTPVVLCGHKESALLPCIFGALKSGRAYVPIDRTVPRERAAQIAMDVAPKLIVDFTGLGLETGARVLSAAGLREILNAPSKNVVSRDHWLCGDLPAYILFTSGSTGRPKGVPITADNLAAFCRGVLPWYPPKEGGVILNQVSYSFDVSGCSLYAGLSRGMTLFTVDHEMAEDLGLLFRFLRGSGLSVWVSTPSFAELCMRSKTFGEELLPQLTEFLFCGEVLTHTLCDQLAERFPKARVLNTYGPTEATVLVTAARITEKMRESACPIPIGQPIEGTRLRLVDEKGREITGDDRPGELLILGGSVGPGYFRRPDLSERSFFTDEITGLRGYRTGDVCYRKEGLYYYQGRADNQLKLNGFRIELEDVERNLEKVDNIARAAVIPVLEDGRAQYLAAFLLLERPDALSGLKRTLRVKRQAAAFLPDYMIPRKIYVVESFPLNVNGKIDKKELARRLREERL